MSTPPGVDRLTALLSAPRWGFHLAVAALAGWLLWSASVPGTAFFSASAAGSGLCLAAIVWVVKLVVSLRSGRPSWWFAVAPIGAIAVVAMLATDAPLRVRWELSRPAFDSAVRELTPDSSGEVSVSERSRIGLYDVLHVNSVPGGLVFYEANGALFDDAGFAYLPDGPTPQVESGDFESPTFEHLGGPWYAFIASW